MRYRTASGIRERELRAHQAREIQLRNEAAKQEPSKVLKPDDMKQMNLSEVRTEIGKLSGLLNCPIERKNKAALIQYRDWLMFKGIQHWGEA